MGGNVGIGTTSPGAKLHVRGSGGVSLPAVGDTLATWFDYSDGRNYLRGDTLFGGDTGILKYDSGNVGIGTTSPSAKLHIAGTSAVLRVGAATDASVVEIEPNRLLAYNRVTPGYVAMNYDALTHSFKVSGDEKVNNQ